MKQPSAISPQPSAALFALRFSLRANQLSTFANVGRSRIGFGATLWVRARKVIAKSERRKAIRAFSRIKCGFAGVQQVRASKISQTVCCRGCGQPALLLRPDAAPAAGGPSPTFSD